MLSVKKTGLIFFFLLPLLSFAKGRAGGNEPPEFLFYYKPYNALLLPAYRGNASALKALQRHVEQRDDASGDYYFSIISYVRQAEARDPSALNWASVQGSVLRAYIRSHFKLPGAQFTFQIDTLGRESNRTAVKLLPLPAPEDLSVIYYSLSGNPQKAGKAMDAYNPIPYTGKPDDSRDTEATPENSRWIGQLEANIRKTDSLDQVISQMNRHSHLRQYPADSIRPADTVFLYQVHTGRKIPFLGIKTNLVYWVGFTPEMKWKQVLPNLSLEFYPGKHWSLELNGAYTRRLVNGQRPECYAFSAFGAEGRYWLRGDYRFTGFYGGIYANGGEFDQTPGFPDGKGYTGKYTGAGLSAGYTHMFSNLFGLELGIRGGFRHISYDIYQREMTHYYYESTKYKNKVSLDGVFLNLIFRFEKHKK